MPSHGNKLFVGLRVSDQLEASTASMKSFFAGNSSEYLQIMQIDSDEYMGNAAASGTSLEASSHMRMNLKTMLQIICPKFAQTEAAIKVLALTPPPRRNLRRQRQTGQSSCKQATEEQKR